MAWVARVAVALHSTLSPRHIHLPGGLDWLALVVSKQGTDLRSVPALCPLSKEYYYSTLRYTVCTVQYRQVRHTLHYTTVTTTATLVQRRHAKLASQSSFFACRARVLF